MKKFFVIIIFQLFIIHCLAQNVGIGTTSPAVSAALEIKATDKGVLFPSLTIPQRDAIQNPASGLHIYNTDERCLNKYDGLFQIWDSYCNPKTVTIQISQDVTGGIDFYNTYAKNYPGITRFAIIVEPGVNVISGGYVADPIFGTYPVPALNFGTMPSSPCEIRVINYGNIVGGGGTGGAGARGATGDNASCIANAQAGSLGGVAIVVTQYTHTVIENYGTIAGGGGGGGGAGRNTTGQYGGGGGGAAFGTGGVGGGTTTIFFGTCSNTPVAQNGVDGIITAGGAGGTGANSGGNGGKGGNLAQAGASGTGNNAGAGGAAGITVLFGGTGSSGIIINNHGSGQVLGTVQ
ncbi:MAG: hypothetical protein JSU03_11600 [Bacteroidetes bacterium]|nr:hypothetical protein [Bacteroidota bacterium]MBS1757915.1 hypothetical protein [Bacteroidota bacterium]